MEIFLAKGLPMDNQHTTGARDPEIQVIGNHVDLEADIHFHEVPTPRSLHQIPEPARTFTGRVKELDQLTKVVRENHATICNLQGMGGIGKTQLALKLAQRLTPHYPDAQIFLDLKGTSQTPLRPVDAMGRVIRAFHPDIELPTSENERHGLYFSVLHNTQALLLLDDAGDAERVAALSPPKSCAMLVTARRCFHMPGTHTLHLGGLEPEDAHLLLREIAPKIGDYAGEVAKLCGFLPLALEVAGRGLAERVDLAPEEYTCRLRNNRRRLDLVDASLSLSYELLDELLQGLWARLAVFSVSFDRKAAGAVWKVKDGRVLGPLGELLRLSLIEWNGEVSRYNLHDLARIFAYDRLEKIEDPRSVHLLAAEHLDVKSTEGRGTAEEALEELDQWERAESWEQFAQRARALARDLDRVGHWEQTEERLGRAVTAVREQLNAPRLEASLLNEMGIVAFRRGNWNQASDMYERSLETYERVGHMAAAATVRANLGIIHREKGEWDHAIELYRECLGTFESAANLEEMARMWTNLGVVYAEKGDWDRALEMHQRSLQMFEHLGDKHGEATALSNLGIVHRNRAEWDRAVVMLEKSLKIYDRLDDAHSVARIRANLGIVHANKGEWDEAIEMYEQSLEIFEGLGAAHSVAKTLHSLANAYANEGKWDRATEMYQQSLETYKHLSDMPGMAKLWHALGLVYAERGDWDQAVSSYKRSITIDQRVGDTRGMAQTFRDLGFAYAEEGEPQRAIETYRRSISAYKSARDIHGLAGVFSDLGLVCKDEGWWGRAKENYERSLELAQQVGDPSGIASALVNLGLVHLEMDQEDEAKHFLGQAYLISSELDLAHADRALKALRTACGSQYAVWGYLAQL